MADVRYTAPQNPCLISSGSPEPMQRARRTPNPLTTAANMELMTDTHPEHAPVTATASWLRYLLMTAVFTIA